MKVLITADIHIDDYSSYNYTDKFRLNQYIKLADRLVEIGKQYNCREIWILGDLINKPTSRAYVLHIARQFLKILSSDFEKIRIILGNHDLDSKSQNLDKINSQVTLFDIPNMEYMDKVIRVIDNHSFAWMNWYPDQDLSWLGDKHIDVLLGHYTKSDLFGQDIDESKFDLMIHGDIHNRQEIGKFISVGNPIPIDFNSLIEDADVLILNTEKITWERILVDPDHSRFLQMHYTEDKGLEGFHGSLEYYVYRPKLSLNQEQSQEKSITWNDIDQLISKLCEQNNVLDIHGKVESNCVPYSEVDFNFQLKRFHIHGYRSIVDLTIDFDKGDRIILLGDNGSGKSSIIKSLKGVFGKNSYLKYEQSDLCEDQLLELSLTYQNKLFEITKGNQCKLIIDGQEQQYSGKNAFENDLKVKLPFLNYLDLLFLTSNVLNLGQFTSARRIELISKFYRLDRINAYWKTAINLYSDIESELNEKRVKNNSQIEFLNTIKSRLSQLKDVESINEIDLYKRGQELDKLTERSIEIGLKTKRQLELVDKLNILKKSIGQTLLKFNLTENDLSFESVDSKISQLEKSFEDYVNNSREKLHELKYRYEELKNILDRLIVLDSRLQDLTDKGSRLNKEIEIIKSKKCPTCGSILAEGMDKDLLESKYEELNKLRFEWSDLSYRRSELAHDKTVLELKNALNVAKNDLENFNQTYKHELDKNNINRTLLGSLKTDSIKSNELEKELIDIKEFLNGTEPVPTNLNEMKSSYTSTLAKYNEYKNLKSQEDEIQDKINSLESEITELSNELDRYNIYISLVSNEGAVMKEVLDQLAVKFSNSEIKYEVESGVYRDSNYINFNSYYLSKGQYRFYDTLSDGQKTLCDINFLDKLFSVQVGLLALDEVLAHLDDKNSPKIYEILRNMNVNTILIATHDSNILAYNRRLLLSLNDKGETTMTQD